MHHRTLLEEFQLRCMSDADSMVTQHVILAWFGKVLDIRHAKLSGDSAMSLEKLQKIAEAHKLGLAKAVAGWNSGRETAALQACFLSWKQTTEKEKEKRAKETGDDDIGYDGKKIGEAQQSSGHTSTTTPSASASYLPTLSEHSGSNASVGGRLRGVPESTDLGSDDLPSLDLGSQEASSEGRSARGEDEGKVQGMLGPEWDLQNIDAASSAGHSRSGYSGSERSFQQGSASSAKESSYEKNQGVKDQSRQNEIDSLKHQLLD
jgi:hypothetical protein